MADRKIDPWELSRKGKLGGSEVFFGASLPNISEIPRELVQKQPCCKRNGHSLFFKLFY